MLYLAALFKLLAGPASTVIALHNAGWTDAGSATALARAVPGLELVLACWPVSGRRPAAAATIALALLLCFSVVLILVGRATGWTHSCGCLGALDRTTVVAGLVRNVLLIGAGAALLVLLRRAAPLRGERPVGP